MELTWTVLLVAALTVGIQVRSVGGDGTVRILLTSYSIPAGKDWNGRACDFLFEVDCDPMFTFCLDSLDDGSDGVTSCTYKQWPRTDRYSNQNNVVFDSNIRGVANPLTYTFTDSSWQGMKFKVLIEDFDPYTNSDKIDSIVIDLTSPASSSWHQVTARGVRTATTPTSLSLSYEVTCSPHFYGPECNKFCQPTNDNDTGHYSCNNNGTKVCLPGWTGEDCTEPAESCASINCSSVGNCIVQAGRTVCTCQPGFTGANCQTKVNNCQSQPCQNGATCQNTVSGGYMCQCTSGFVGSRCEHHVCTHNPCLNGAFCFDNGTCQCPSSRFSGPRCEIDRCTASPCSSNGQCDSVTGECHCAPGYQGDRCDVTSCLMVTCDTSNLCATDKCLCPVTSDNLPLINSPSCLPRMLTSTAAARRCNVNVTCEDGSLAHCVLRGAHFWCQCAQTKVKVGEAPPCDDDSTLMASCGEGLCFNGGTCLQPSNTCVCAPGYTGTWCTAGMYAATSGQSQQAGLIVGLCIAGLVLVLLVAGVVVIFRRRSSGAQSKNKELRDVYGCQEVGKSSLATPHQLQHVNHDDEVRDKRPLYLTMNGHAHDDEKGVQSAPVNHYSSDADVYVTSLNVQRDNAFNNDVYSIPSHYKVPIPNPSAGQHYQAPRTEYSTLHAAKEGLCHIYCSLKNATFNNIIFATK